MRNKVILLTLIMIGFASTLNAQTVEWERTYGDSGVDGAYSMQQTSDSGFILSGYTQSFSGDAGISAWLIKTNVFGDTVWTKTFGDSAGQQYGNSVQQTDDGGYVLTGSTLPCCEPYADVLLIKTDYYLGKNIWRKWLGRRQKCSTDK